MSDKELTWEDLNDVTWSELGSLDVTWNDLKLPKLELLQAVKDKNILVPIEAYEKLKKICETPEVHKELGEESKKIMKSRHLTIGQFIKISSSLIDIAQKLEWLGPKIMKLIDYVSIHVS